MQENIDLELETKFVDCIASGAGNMKRYFAANGYEKGSRLVSDIQSWGPLTTLLQHQVECNEGCQLTKNPRQVAADWMPC